MLEGSQAGSQNIPLFQKSPSLSTWGQGQFTEPHNPCAAQLGGSCSPAPSPAPAAPSPPPRGSWGGDLQVSVSQKRRLGQVWWESLILPWLTADSQAHPPLCSPLEPESPTAGEPDGTCSWKVTVPSTLGPGGPSGSGQTTPWGWQGRGGTGHILLGKVPEPGAAPMSPQSLGWPAQGVNTHSWGPACGRAAGHHGLGSPTPLVTCPKIPRGDRRNKKGLQNPTAWPVQTY